MVNFLTTLYLNSPRWIRNIVRRVIDGKGFLGMIADNFRYRYRPSDIPESDALPFSESKFKLFIGPNNASGQAYEWSRSMENKNKKVKAFSINGTDSSVYKTKVDLEIKPAVFLRSKQWHKNFEDFLLNQTQILYESLLPLLGRKFDTDVEREIDYFKNSGIEVATIFHGTDIRLPSINIQNNKWSPFISMGRKAEFLEEQAFRNLKIVERISIPAGVSTPDLLVYLPTAVWVPTVVDINKFTLSIDSSNNRTLRVVHAPTNRLLKGTDLIEPTLRRLEAHGQIEYKTVEGVTPEESMRIIREADIVLDQFVIDGYGVVALEALSMGKIVLGHVSNTTRNKVKNLTGWDLPIVEADPDNIGSVLEGIISNRDGYASNLNSGVEFVKAIHSGSFSAEQLCKLFPSL